MAKIFPKNAFWFIAFLTVAIGIGILYLADIISFQGLQGDILNVQQGYYEARSEDNRIAAEVRMPSEIMLTDQEDFFIPVTILGRRGNVRLLEANVVYSDTIRPQHYASAMLNDEGSTLDGPNQHILATIRNTQKEGKPLFRLKGILQGESGEIQMELRFAIGDEIFNVGNILAIIRKGESL